VRESLNRGPITIGLVTVGDRYALGTQRYLRDVQYKDSTRHQARADLHRKYTTASVSWFSWVLAQIEWPANAEVLEVGCGPGWLWTGAGASALSAGLSLSISDLSIGMVETARERIRGSEAVALEAAVVADGQRLPFVDDSFDVVVANHVLFHMADPGEAAREAARVLRRQGVLLATTVGIGHFEEIRRIVSSIFGGPLTNRNAQVFGSVTGVPLLKESFSSVDWRTYDDTLRCTDPKDVFAYVTSGPLGDTASSGQLRDLRTAIARSFEEGGGVFIVSKEIGAFVARGPRKPPTLQE